MRTTNRQGSALLAVMWLAAALAAIAFSVAANVRAETERASTTADGLRAYYMATGAVNRGILYILWGGGYKDPDGSPMFYRAPMPRIPMNFPGGQAIVDVIPEGGKLSVNSASELDLMTLFGTLGVDRDRAIRLTAGIIAWRSPNGAPPLLGPNFSPGSTFLPRRASLEELEEILLIPGMTPDLFYGRFDHDSSGRLIPRGGLKDCLTVWGGGTKVDVNTASVELLQSLGVTPAGAKALVARRLAKVFENMDEVAQFVPDPAVRGRMGIGGSTIWTLRATAAVRTPNGKLSEVRRSVSAVVKLLDAGKWDPPFHILRWNEDAWSPTAPAY